MRDKQRGDESVARASSETKSIKRHFSFRALKRAVFFGILFCQSINQQGELNSDPDPDQDFTQDLDPFLRSGSLLGPRSES
jgi:hypothetical protein